MTEEFLRTAMLIGETAVEKLNGSSVLIFGLGGVGSYTVEALARAGVGKLTIADGDTVTLSNINRQLYALHSSVGKYKTDVAKERILDINPNCKITAFPEFLTPENADMFFSSEYDFCIDAIDDTTAKTAIAVKCNEKNIPLIASMGTGSKLHGELFKITDINKTEYCPLCRVMRRKYREAGLKNVTVLFSPEQPVKPQYAQSGENSSRPVPSSISFIPSQAGLRIAQYTVEMLTKT